MHRGHGSIGFVVEGRHFVRCADISVMVGPAFVTGLFAEATRSPPHRRITGAELGTQDSAPN